MLITVSNRSGSYALPFQPGQTLLDALRQAGLPVSAPCGGRGTCGKCTVYLSTPDGERAVLACQTAAEDGMALRLLEEEDPMLRVLWKEALTISRRFFIRKMVSKKKRMRKP